MRKFILAVAALLCGMAFAKGVLPSQVYRRGLTNEQIDFIMERRPDTELRLTQKDWQGMRFELCRYHNITNWCDIVNDKAGFAAMLAEAQDKTNSLAKAVHSLSNQLAVADAGYANLYASWQESTNRIAALSVDYAAATNREAIAEARAARLDALRDYLVEQRDKAALPTTKAIYQALIDKIDSYGGK